MPPDSNPPAGATPVAPGATPGQSEPAHPAGAPAAPAAPPAAPPATGDDDDAALGDKGKAAIDRMKSERNAALTAKKAAEDELERVKAASQTEAERALTEAKKAGATEAATKLSARIRATEARSALIAAGADPGLVELAAKADQFATLKVSDDGEVEGLEEAVKAFKTANPAVFPKAPAPPKPGSADQGARGAGAPERATSLQGALEKRFAGS